MIWNRLIFREFTREIENYIFFFLLKKKSLLNKINYLGCDEINFESYEKPKSLKLQN